MTQETNTWLTAEDESDLREPDGQAGGPPSRRVNDTGDAFGEDPSLAGTIGTEEAPGMEAENAGPTGICDRGKAAALQE